jgi:Zinc finger, C3HC4 type (RING finger)
MNLNYLAFNENNSNSSFIHTRTPDPRTNRDLFDLLDERDSFYERGIYNSVFDKISEKLFVCSETEIDLSEPEYKELELKYNVLKTQENISKLKRDIAKIEHELLLEERMRLYDTFCNNILNTVKSIADITKQNLSEKDSHLQDILNDRIEWYYKELDIDNLVKIDQGIKSEFHFLKKILTELSGLHPTVCSICMENQISWYIDPCGHTLCTECKLKTENNRSCHYCRTDRTKFNRLYL